jgi:hypothetical protein
LNVAIVSHGNSSVAPIAEPEIADRLQRIVLSFAKAPEYAGGASIDLRELSGSTEDEFTDLCTTQRWNSQSSECEYSRSEAARNAYSRVRYGRSFDGDQTSEAPRAAYPADADGPVGRSDAIAQNV